MEHFITVFPSPLTVGGSVPSEPVEVNCIHFSYDGCGQSGFFKPFLCHCASDPSSLVFNKGTALHILHFVVQDSAEEDDGDYLSSPPSLHWTAEPINLVLEGGCGGPVIKVLQQRTFDAESWLASRLGPHCGSLLNYAMEVVKIIDHESCAMLLLGSWFGVNPATTNMQALFSCLNQMCTQPAAGLPLIHVTNNNTNMFCAFLLELHLPTGTVRQTFLRSEPTVCGPNVRTAATQFSRTVSSFADNLQMSIPASVLNQKMFLTNKSVFTGDTLPYILHPFFPIGITCRAGES
eukprot:gnl/Hemi2/23951_TR8036_c0_g1_i1.p1 gnl/Hemi2/23951_TR8036_c0_g1~~gnl/Hemi2/23951_TR8036_c0_g1_i1.p1  ORF type:complete len:292 (-),score=38.95 gnl/Hemi2/23951_TR8036_c0_g1_i1:132-1007(-)